MKKNEREDNLQLWQGRLSRAKALYAKELEQINERERMYYGRHEIHGAKKHATNVRNITYEMVESQTDPSVPMPKVTAIHAEDAPLARRVENLLRNEIQRLRFKELNDASERVVPVQGADFWHIEWDSTAGFHCTLGDVTVTQRHPRQIIPQPGVSDLERMDYVFVILSKTKESLQAQYGVELDSDTEDSPEVRGEEEGTVEGLVSQNLAYYRHDGKVGLFSWVGSQVLEDVPDYYARTAECCIKCGRRRVADVCSCGGRKFAVRAVNALTLDSDVTLPNGEVIPALQPGKDEPVLNPDGSFQLDDMTGEPILMPGQPQATEVPVYSPTGFPLVERLNVSACNRFLGVSDVDVIRDQQQAINKYGTKIQEKLLKGGSYVTLPQGVNIETTDAELKVIRLDNPAQREMVSVINVQPNTSYDQQMLETNYAWAKSTLGITDSFQGKYDASATSGSAKQFSANQAAGRLQSKREMKNAAYARLYRLMFQFLLAYADEKYPITETDTNGEQQWGHFDRMDFLRRDEAGELYWNDEFIFEVDPASNLASNRERLWDMIDVKYQAGGFGPISELQSQHLLWTLLKETGFPYAATMQQAIKERMEQQVQAMPDMTDTTRGEVLV